MALLSDGQINGIEQLQAMDASVVEVARVERIDLDQKLWMATQVVNLRVKKFLIDQGLTPSVAGASGEVDFGRIVVTPGMTRWHALESLTGAYSDAYYSQLNDRYKQKWEHYRMLATDAARLFFDTGVGGVNQGVPRAKEAAVGTTGVPAAEAVYFVSVALKNTLGQEGAPSEPVLFTASELLTVQPSETVSDGWKFEVYIGLTDASMTKQTTTPVDAGQVWSQAPGALLAGAPMGEGQPPEFYLRRTGTLQRG
jgi:hypothetical protein